MPSYVIYARKSTESEDRQVLSIDSQITELHELAARHGIRIAEILSESRSAKAPGRPVFNALIRRVQKGAITGILCWKMDRLARNHLDTGVILQALADGKLQEIITSDRTYTCDGNDRFMGTFELGMATKYIDDLRANIRRGNRARFARGWVNYHPPIGYCIDPATKTIVKDPERFPLVRRMWDLLLTGSYQPRQILALANSEWGLRTRRTKRRGGNPVSRPHLYDVLGNPFYAGVIRLRSGETFAGAHPAMVTRQEFERVQELLGRPGRQRPQQHAFPFTGLIKCGNCQSTITAEEHVKPSGRRYTYYHCSRHKKGPPCREPAIPAPDLERQFGERLHALSMPETVLQWLVRRVEATIHQEEDRRTSVRASLQAALASTAREQENLLSLRLRDLVDDETFRVRKLKLDQERQNLQDKIATPIRSREEVSDLTKGTFSFARRASEAFLQGTGVQRRMILEATGSNFELRSRKVLYQLKNPFRMIAEAGSCSNWWTCPDDVRTWIQETKEYFALPDLDSNGSIPYELYPHKVG
jgi:site-specific DNA recombinase